MSRFWKSMRRGREATIGTMGEPVVFGSLAGSGVVQDFRTDPKLVDGGTSDGLMFRVEVSLEYGEAIGDGDTAEVRGAQGRVTSKEHAGGSWLIDVGPVNRAAAEAFF
jgi:hypothetical protein